MEHGYGDHVDVEHLRATRVFPGKATGKPGASSVWDCVMGTTIISYQILNGLLQCVILARSSFKQRTRSKKISRSSWKR